MGQRLDSISQETRNPEDLHALDERVRSYTHLASRNQYLVLIISLTWAAMYHAIVLNSGLFLSAVAPAISTSILLLFIRKLWLTQLKRIDERAKQLIMSSYSWASLYVYICALAILLYLRLFVASFEHLHLSYLYLPAFLSLATGKATLLVNRVSPAGTYTIFWFNVIFVAISSLIELSSSIILLNLINVPLVFIILSPILEFSFGALLLALIVIRHDRRKPRLEDE